MRVLLSIRPTHVESILSGYKKFEFRRRMFVRRDVRSVLIYCTKPIGRLVAEFDIADILEDTPASLWHRTSSASGITKEYFDRYFEGRETAFAIQIGEIRIFREPLIPADIFTNFTPPQSYMYVPTLVEMAGSA